MASTELLKRTLSLIIFVALMLAILIGLHIFNDWFTDYLSANPDFSPLRVNAVEMGIKVTRIIFRMLMVIAIIRYIAFILMRTAARHSAKNEIATLLKTVFSIIAYILAFALIFQSQFPNVPLDSLFTGSTILGIVVGLALQDTLGNLFSGIATQADRPFQVGDVISIGSRGSGVIESVSWRAVKIRTFQNKLLVISNSVLGKESFEVAPRGNLNARAVYFNTVFSVSPSRTSHVVRDALRGAENVSTKMRPVVRIRNFGDSSLDWEVKYWLDDYNRHNDTDALVRERIWYAFQREKIDFASPTQIIKMHEKLPEVSVEEKINVRSDRLQRVPIFTPLSDDELEKLAGASRSRIYSKGETIVQVGAEGNSMFVIVRGSVNVQIPGKNGPKTINRLGENDFFGEMSLLTGQPRTASVVADIETEVLSIGKKALKPILENNEMLVTAICERIEERRQVLDSEAAHQSEDTSDSQDLGVVESIRRFFGLRSRGNGSS